MITDHTFLFEEATWQAKGYYLDEAGHTYPLLGETQFSHKSGVWVNIGKMNILGPHKMEFENRYEITPFQEGKDNTTWESYNSAIGQLKGHFVIIEETILSVYQTEDRDYKGIESIQKISDDIYRSRGALFKGGQKISSWTVILTRVVSFSCDRSFISTKKFSQKKRPE